MYQGYQLQNWRKPLAKYDKTEGTGLLQSYLALPQDPANLQ